ncbi:leucine-rich repeat extensin-like protein 1 [Teleopsis dalmanni]|uniref:leucine-rich repeat extensin-like protein 1 n=1 Tax=Teleopsis dalmanni TaxID=139649 RepID=UPI0018CC8539|nr:leucine-rich repeat extensin-like protein 1 [Teleopsis dalmanni]
MLSSATAHLPAGVTVTESVSSFNLFNRQVKYVSKFYKLNNLDIVETLTVFESDADGEFRVVYHGEVISFPDIQSAVRAENLYRLQCNNNYTYQRILRYSNEPSPSPQFAAPSPHAHALLQPQLAYATPPPAIRIPAQTPTIFVPSSPALYPQSPFLYTLPTQTAVAPTMLASPLTPTTPCHIQGSRGPRLIYPNCMAPYQHTYSPVLAPFMPAPVFATTAYPMRSSRRNNGRRMESNSHAYSMIVPSNMYHIDYPVPQIHPSVPLPLP